MLLVEMMEAAKRGDELAAGRALVAFLHGTDVGYHVTGHDDAVTRLDIERRQPEPEA